MRFTRVLLVDDDTLVLRALQRLLRPLSHLVVSTAIGVVDGHAKARYAAAAGERFDIVCSDIDMPDGSGFEMAQMICLDVKSPPRFVFMSGFVTGRKQEEAAALGSIILEKTNLVAIANELSDGEYENW